MNMVSRRNRRIFPLKKVGGYRRLYLDRVTIIEDLQDIFLFYLDKIERPSILQVFLANALSS